MDNQKINISINNAFQNSVDVPIDRLYELGNLSINNPSVEQINAAITSGMTSNVAPTEPAFGEHIREAVSTLRRVFK